MAKVTKSANEVKPREQLIKDLKEKQQDLLAANATHNHNLEQNSLQITTISVTAGPRLKRFKPHMRGTSRPFQKKSSHILVVVEGTIKPKKTPKTTASSSNPAKAATEPTTNQKESK